MMARDPTTADRSIRQRLARVYLQWTSTRMLLRRFFRDHQLAPPECAFYIAAVIGLFLLQSEKLIWKRLGPTNPAPPDGGSPDALRDLLWTQPFADFWLAPFDGLDAADSAWLWLGLIVVYPVNAWLFDCWIARTSGAEASIRPWLRRLRWLLAGVPWLGVAIFPAWRWLLDRRPPWALASDPPPDLARGQPQMLSRRRLPQVFHRFLERLSESSTFTAIWVVAPNFLALRAALAWLDAPGRLGNVGLITALVGCAVLHGLAFVCLAYFLAARARERQLGTLKQGFLWLQAATLVLPMPAAILAFLTFGQVDGGRLKTILYRLHNSGSYPASLQESVARAGGRLPGPLGWWLGSAESSDDSVARYRRLKLYRLKTFLLLIDVATIARLGLWAADRAFVFDLAAGLVLGGGAALAAIGLVISFPACSYQFFLRPARDRAWLHDKDHYPVMRYVMLTSLALLAGFLLVNTSQDPRDLAEGLLLVGAFGFLLAAAFLLPAIGRFFTDGDRDYCPQAHASGSRVEPAQCVR